MSAWRRPSGGVEDRNVDTSGREVNRPEWRRPSGGVEDRN